MMVISKERRVALVLTLATLLPVGALAWLGVRAVQQDRAIERQRHRERLEVAATRLALDLDRRLQTIERDLSAGHTIQLTVDGVNEDGAPILFQPIAPESPSISSPDLANAETAEFQRHDLAAAADAYRRLAAESNPDVRAAALVALARVLRQTGDQAEALDAYSQLQQLGTVRVANQPAALVAGQGRCKVFEESGDMPALRRESSALAGVLFAGGWLVDRATFEVYRDLLAHWGAESPSRDALDKTEAAIQVWRLWRAGDLAPSGRRFVRTDAGRAVLAMWSESTEDATVWLGTTAQLAGMLELDLQSAKIEASIYDTDGQLMVGHTTAGALSLTPGETRLPFVLSVSASAGFDDGDRRPALLLSGLFAAFALMLAAAYVLCRTTTQEIAVARQQSDFVSAVSHEFRTPLTSMRHLTELLASGAVSSDERRTQYYDFLSTETERLHRLVESLLSFGRIEAGAYAWRVESTDPRDLLERIAEEFRREPMAREREITCEIEANMPPIQIDRDAVSRALWNLLENASKYSPPGTPIRLFARREGACIHLGVGDRGLGIPSAERHAVFQKFVRGADAKRAGVGGVGIGLTLVQRIVEAHGGTVQVESEPGHGSTFTLVIPCPES
jgi:signal transduction histidine kinase